MRTLLCDPPPAGVEALLERRRRLGQDRRDEVWEGVLHVVPAASAEHADIAQQLGELLGPLARMAGLWPTHEFNLGDSTEDYRVPDGGLHRSRPHGVWIATAALAIEILSPGDETWEKLPFYAAHGVDELLILDPEKRSVDWLALHKDETDGTASYQPIARSRLIALSPAQLAQQIDWP